MDVKQFLLEITLGGDAMKSPEDIAKALRKVADRLEAWAGSDGVIHDEEGNKVGFHMYQEG